MTVKTPLTQGKNLTGKAGNYQNVICRFLSEK
jgi:hypothetical protein